jgi:hypothetical protein
MPRLFAEKTKVPVIQTRGEIERMLGRFKCSSYGTAVDYEQRKARVQFKAHDRIIRFELTLPDPGRHRVKEKFEQEERRVWRALMLVIKAKLEAVENSIATFEEEFLAHVVMPNDQTVATILQPIIADAYARGQMPRALLGPGTPDGDDAAAPRSR